MNLRPEEISSVIKEQIKQYSTQLETSDIGTVIQVAAANPSMPCSVRYFIQMYTEEGTKHARKINKI
ncbi:hypothetical protein KQI13_14625 [Anaerostipes hadrus]|nr:hypothetical protein [Anaerostipes hadrus]